MELTWYDGNKRPELLKEVDPPDSNYPWYVLLVGAEGMLIAAMDTFRLYPEEKFAGVRRPRLPQGLSHADEWLAACKTGTPTGYPLRLLRASDRDGAAGDRRLSRRPEAPVGCGEPEGHKLSGSGTSYPARYPPRVDVVATAARRWDAISPMLWRA